MTGGYCTFHGITLHFPLLHYPLVYGKGSGVKADWNPSCLWVKS